MASGQPIVQVEGVTKRYVTRFFLREGFTDYKWLEKKRKETGNRTDLSINLSKVRRCKDHDTSFFRT